MGFEENKALIERYMQAAWNKGDVDSSDQLLNDDFVDHNTPPGITSDRAGHRQSVKAFHAVFPDAAFTLEDVIAEGDKVVVRWKMQAHHRGKFLGIPATGKVCLLEGIDIYQVADGKIVASWHREDMLGLLRQIKPNPAHAET